MKHFRILLPVLILALVIFCCTGKPLPYEYTSGGTTATVDPINRTIAFGEKTFPYTVDGTRTTRTYYIHFPDGSEYHWTYIGTGSGITGWSENFDFDRWSYAEFMMDALKQPTPREKSGNIIVGLLLIGLGAAIFFIPVLGFYLCYGVVVEKAKLSDAQITMAKFGGAVMALLGLVWCVV